MMFSKEVLIRRYTPPTCTLELSGHRSPLYLWTGQNRVKDLQFELRFDDPRKPTEDQIIVKGDRTQLQLLGDVVNHYLQNFLKTSGTYLPLATNSITTLLPSTINIPSIPSLQPRGLLTHELSFGSLTVEPPQASISLTASQLYDLANALEEYRTDVSILRAIAKPLWQQVAATWITTATTAFLVALGVGIASMRIREMQQTATPVNPEEKPTQSIVKDVVPPVPPPPGGTPVPSPQVPPSLAQRQPLPSPSTVVALPPPPRNPSVPVVVPPNAVLPPPPVVPQVNSPAIVITPRTTNPTTARPGSVPTLPPPSTSRATQNVSPQAFNPNPQAPNLPELPPLASSATPSPTAANSTNSSKTTLLDTIPQVGEARQYFQARWKPPESLKQTLEYRLVLNSDGSIGQIVPLGQASKVYLDRTNMPLIGESFVSPLEVAGNPQIRLVLSPDGTVRTFMEQ